MREEFFKIIETKIVSESLRNLTIDYFNKVVPKYFWSVPASSTGKYHPSISLGEGGLVRHTICVFTIAEELLKLRMFSYLNIYKDEIFIACLIHDTYKSGEKEGYTIHEHPLIAAEQFSNFANSKNLSNEDLKKVDIIKKCVQSHMGQWTTSNRSEVILPLPTESYEKFVHLCDFLASRKLIGNYKND